MDEIKSVRKMTDEERVETVKSIFSTITKRYDFLNRTLSLRRDVAWRKSATSEMQFFDTYRMLDVATGTGDLAILTAKTFSSVRVIGIDFVKEMLDKARDKIKKNNIADRVEFLFADALKIPFESNTFDVVGIAFGIRNIPDKRRALGEMQRVLAPSGKIIILELTLPNNNILMKFYNFYLNKIMPRIASYFSKKQPAYSYLADSIIHFPSHREFFELLKQAGFLNIHKIPLTFGIAHLYVGYKPKN